MSIMGIGTNLLGYGHPDVDSAVATAVAAGNMSTLNCPEEVWLAELLVAVLSASLWGGESLSAIEWTGGALIAAAALLEALDLGPKVKPIPLHKEPA